MKILEEIQQHIEKELDQKFSIQYNPIQGMDSHIFKVKDSASNEFIIKVNRDLKNEILAYQKIVDKNINIPIPKIIKFFQIDNYDIILMEKLNFPLLEETSSENFHNYLQSMVGNLKKLHTIKSKYSGDFTKQKSKLTWKNVFLSKFTDPKILNWTEISNRKELNKDLLLNSLDKFIHLIQRTNFINTDYSLLHTDFNQRNLFVDTKNKRVAGIVDWEESLFGDPIYDFARIRMLFWHYNLDKKIIKEYFDVMNYNEEEKSLENLYFISRILEYLAYYSEANNDFNRKRIQLHESFLKDLDWETV